jgi:hypothetical protein
LVLTSFSFRFYFHGKTTVASLPSQNGLIIYWVMFMIVLGQFSFCLLKKMLWLVLKGQNSLMVFWVSCRSIQGPFLSVIVNMLC